MKKIETLIWVANKDPKVAQQLANVISEVIDCEAASAAIIHSELNQKSLLAAMGKYDPDFFQKSVKHTYQDLYHEQAKELERLRKALTPEAILNAKVGYGEQTLADVLTFYDDEELFDGRNPLEPQSEVLLQLGAAIANNLKERK